MTEVEKAWLSGVIDGDGCFTISLQKQHNGKAPRLNIWCQICITAKTEDSWYLDEIAKMVGFGKVYFKRQGSPQGYSTATYQTTSFEDTLNLTKLVYPYLMLKKEKAQKLIEVLEYWTSVRGRRKAKRSLGQRERTAEEVLKIVKVACEINADRQTRRYKDKLTYEQWEPLIKEWYPES